MILKMDIKKLRSLMTSNILIQIWKVVLTDSETACKVSSHLQLLHILKEYLNTALVSRHSF